MRHKLFPLALLATLTLSLASAATFGRVVPIGGPASDIALDEGRGLLYIANYTSARIDVMSLSDNTISRSMDSPVRPFLAAGAGVKFYQGTGAEPAFQPLSNLVVLSHTTEAQPLVSVGGGVKFRVAKHALLRVDFRDYATPLPTNLLAVPGNSKLRGWIHDFVFLAGVSTTF